MSEPLDSPVPNNYFRPVLPVQGSVKIWDVFPFDDTDEQDTRAAYEAACARFRGSRYWMCAMREPRVRGAWSGVSRIVGVGRPMSALELGDDAA